MRILRVRVPHPTSGSVVMSFTNGDPHALNNGVLRVDRLGVLHSHWFGPTGWLEFWVEEVEEPNG